MRKWLSRKTGILAESKEKKDDFRKIRLFRIFESKKKEWTRKVCLATPILNWIYVCFLFEIDSNTNIFVKLFCILVLIWIFR